MSGAELLKTVSLFEGVDPTTMSRLFEAGRVLRFPAGDYVVRQGEYGDSLYVILRGEATVESTGVDGRVTRITRLRTGDYFGELALLGRGERKASVKSRSDSKMLELRKVHFDKTLRKEKQVKRRLEEIYTRNAILNFISHSRYFRGLEEASKEQLIATSRLQSFKKDDVIAREGQPAQALFVVRTGFVRVSRTADDQGEEILAYLGQEDFFGDEEATKSAPYGATAVAVEPVECIVVPRSTVWKIYLKQPELFREFRRYSTGRSAQQSGLLESKTSMGFVRDMLEAGLGQARSALIINLDACVRCGNCVQACDDLHGFSRIARRGKKMTHRKSLDSDRRHESLYFPTSCLQCATPECMVGCPTGAIARDVGGEVYIKDTCIGCGSCARNCDFGNIAMAKADAEDGWLLGMVGKQKEPEQNKADLIAVKCDVCFEREFAACVYNCPTEAILRVDPHVYFEELQAIAPKARSREEAPAGAKTTTKRRKTHWVDALLQAFALFGALIGGAWIYRTYGAKSHEGLGLYAGVAGVVLMFLLALMGVRKRLRTHRFGRLALWARAHSIAAGLMLGIVLFHAQYQANSILGSLLLMMLVFCTAIGLGGEVANLVIPRWLASTEDEALLPEDLSPKIRSLLDENAELTESMEDRRRGKLLAHAEKLTQSGLTYLRRRVGPKSLNMVLEARARKLPALPEWEHALVIRVAENLAHSRLLSMRRGLEILLTSWLPLHLVSSAILMTLLIGHIVTVVLW